MRVRKPADALKVREKMGMSQSELTKLLRLTDNQTVRRWENGANKHGLPGPIQIVYEALSEGWRPKGWKGK
jgi:transcriptional regulator with XRE-family HTH domain